MKYAIALVVIAMPMFVMWASFRGRVQVRCCTGAAQQDLRMRSAFEEDHDVEAAPNPR